jgi:DNA (cytosine-5)-methyltransferase 1
VRKYEVDTEKLKSELREHKSLSNKEIAERLDVPKTTVDHRFRIDNCFAIPDAEIRFRLKELL